MAPMLMQTSGTDAGSGVVVILIAILALLALASIPASIARRKFRSPAAFFVFGFLFWLPTLIVALVIPAKQGPPCVACGAPLQLVREGKRYGAKVLSARVCLACGAQQPGPAPAMSVATATQPTGPAPSPVPLAPAAPSLPAESVTVPLPGMSAYEAPDPSAAIIAALDGGLGLRVTERRADWARVEASNGWSGWVDGRLLVPASAPGSATA